MSRRSDTLKPRSTPAPVLGGQGTPSDVRLIDAPLLAMVGVNLQGTNDTEKAIYDSFTKWVSQKTGAHGANHAAAATDGKLRLSKMIDQSETDLRKGVVGGWIGSVIWQGKVANELGALFMDYCLHMESQSDSTFSRESILKFIQGRCNFHQQLMDHAKGKLSDFQISQGGSKKGTCITNFANVPEVRQESVLSMLEGRVRLIQTQLHQFLASALEHVLRSLNWWSLSLTDKDEFRHEWTSHWKDPTPTNRTTSKGHRTLNRPKPIDEKTIDDEIDQDTGVDKGLATLLAMYIVELVKRENETIKRHTTGGKGPRTPVRDMLWEEGWKSNEIDHPDFSALLVQVVTPGIEAMLMETKKGGHNCQSCQDNRSCMFCGYKKPQQLYIFGAGHMNPKGRSTRAKGVPNGICLGDIQATMPDIKMKLNATELTKHSPACANPKELWNYCQQRGFVYGEQHCDDEPRFDADGRTLSLDDMAEVDMYYPVLHVCGSCRLKFVKFSKVVKSKKPNTSTITVDNYNGILKGKGYINYDILRELSIGWEVGTADPFCPNEDEDEEDSNDETTWKEKNDDVKNKLFETSIQSTWPEHRRYPHVTVTTLSRRKNYIAVSVDNVSKPGWYQIWTFQGIDPSNNNYCPGTAAVPIKGYGKGKGKGKRTGKGKGVSEGLRGKRLQHFKFEGREIIVNEKEEWQVTNRFADMAGTFDGLDPEVILFHNGPQSESGEETKIGKLYVKAPGKTYRSLCIDLLMEVDDGDQTMYNIVNDILNTDDQDDLIEPSDSRVLFKVDTIDKIAAKPSKQNKVVPVRPKDVKDAIEKLRLEKKVSDLLNEDGQLSSDDFNIVNSTGDGDCLYHSLLTNWRRTDYPDDSTVTKIKTLMESMVVGDWVWFQGHPNNGLSAPFIAKKKTTKTAITDANLGPAFSVLAPIPVLTEFRTALTKVWLALNALNAPDVHTAPVGFSQNFNIRAAVEKLQLEWKAVEAQNDHVYFKQALFETLLLRTPPTVNGQQLNYWYTTEPLKPHGMTDEVATSEWFTPIRYILHQVSRGVWGGTIELWAAAEKFNACVVVCQHVIEDEVGKYKTILVHDKRPDHTGRVWFVVFKGKSHYDALTPKTDKTQQVIDQINNLLKS